MAKNKQQKQETVQELLDKFQHSKSIIFANFQGLTVSQSKIVRVACHQQNIDCLVAKKTLLKLVLEKLGYQGIDPSTFSGGIAVVFGLEDEVAPAKVLTKFTKQFSCLKMFAGILDNKAITALDLVNLSNIPSKDQLLAKVVGSINAPVSNFVSVLGNTVRQLFNVLNAIKEHKV